MANQNVLAQVKSIPLLSGIAWHGYNFYWRIKTFFDLRTRIELSDNTVAYSREAYAEPSLKQLSSQLCTAQQCLEERYHYWCHQMRSPARLGRKQWEFVFILEALEQQGMLKQGKKGLGFGCGNEPLSAVMAKHDVQVLATDLEVDIAAEKGWVDTNQHASAVERMPYGGICSKSVFLNKVNFQHADMNNIDPALRGFDFVWSACALEHLGSLRHGMDFVISAMDCLSPGGVAVHTTEFNLSSNQDTFEDPNCAVYRKKDIELLAAELTEKGYEVLPINFNPGGHQVDNHVDWPPYSPSIHLKLMLESYVVTSIGLVIKKPFD